MAQPNRASGDVYSEAAAAAASAIAAALALPRSARA
jgi:hypothetical protein